MLLIRCSLCYGNEVEFYARDQRREYHQCRVCGLVQVPPDWHLAPEEERACYEHHENHPDDPAYRAFLGRLFEPVRRRLSPGAEGLDFGSGPGPVLSLMFREQGFLCHDYDPFFAPDAHLLKRAYDFITATEVVEHLSAPGQTLDLLWSLTRPGGLLALMTKRVISRERFAHWHYKNDPTHICFFETRTFAWLANRWQAPVEFHGDDTVVFSNR